ncbi:MAG: hypothetical protein JWR45_3869, partial [Blastococcus sp.]|nr:hypothetical protein [Blastococcus sp.]
MHSIKHSAYPNQDLYHNPLYHSKSTTIRRVQPSYLRRHSATDIDPSNSSTFDLYNFSPITSAPSPAHATLIKLPVLVEGHSAIALIDCGATTNFVDSSFVSKFAIPTQSIDSPIRINLGDGTQRTTAAITHPVRVQLGEQQERLQLVICPLSGCDLVLGMPWLVERNPSINWRSKCVQFNHISRPDVSKHEEMLVGVTDASHETDME